MKKLVLLFVLALSYTTSHAQFGKILKNKAAGGAKLKPRGDKIKATALFFKK